MKFVNVIVDISSEKLDRVFQYRVPERLQEQLQIGMQVSFPFGKGNRSMKGYVVGFSDETDYPLEKIKELDGIVKGSVKAESQLIALAAWMREMYGSTMNQALKTVLPVKQEKQQKQSRQLRRLVTEEEGKTLLNEFVKKNYRAKIRLMAALLDEPVLSWKKVTEELKITVPVIKKFEEDKILFLESETVYRNPFEGHFKKREEYLILNEEQQAAVDEIWSEYEQGIRKTYLLHGVTGSGKTEVYMELIARVIALGKQAIVLIPEIALTFQTVRRFYERFGDRVSVMHSRLSEGERYDQFMRAKEGSIDVMIGPRSALFTPFSQTGIIIIDEEHESSYKSEQVPRYHAREAAIFRAQMCGASVVLGSATPSMESYYHALEGDYGCCRLTKRIGTAQMAEVSVIDLRTELKEGNRSIFSRKLYEAMYDRLQKGQQTMLFLNRRGLSGFVSCRSCGKAIRCPHCDVTLSLHSDGKLKCHYCGYETGMPEVCPACGSRYITGFRAGTQQIEKEVKKFFPKARVLRMDYDTTRTKESYEQILSAFGQGEADVLVGTQMIVKGHDFPNVTLVGVLAADISLYATDYRSVERTFQLLTQAVGRTGRGSRHGEAVIQTYVPDHYSIQTAAKQDYEEFYWQEMLYRNLMGYPPAFSMLGIYLSCTDEEMLEEQAKILGDCIERGQVQGLTVVGPADAALAKKNDIYRKVIYLKHEQEKVLLGIKKELEKEMEREAVWQKVYVQFDFNPLNAF
ncbi:MAG: primosomal protein N' [Lachnospiraceae bacterium]|nr:primosomal protein N' [Lachnospiraceae bacterium]